MDLKTGCWGPAGLAKDTSGNVGLAASKGFSHPYSPLPHPSFLLSLSKAAPVFTPPRGKFSCFPGDTGLSDRSGSQCEDPENPFYRFCPFGGFWTCADLELFTLRRIKISTRY